MVQCIWKGQDSEGKIKGMKKICKKAICCLLFLIAFSLLFSTGVQAAAFPFADVPVGHWCHTYVAWVYENGLMSGTGVDTFAPNETLTREMFVTVLHRYVSLHAEDLQIGPIQTFVDVPAQATIWYVPGIQWAVSQNITAGVGGGRFGIGEAVTREQMACFLYRYMQQNLHLDLSAWKGSVSFIDQQQISTWAREAVAVLANIGILVGDGSGFVLPKQATTRAQAAVIFFKFASFLDAQPQLCRHVSTATVPGTDATCLQAGLSEGERCVSCGTVIVAQQEITPLGHAFGKWETVSATEQQRRCMRCGSVEKETIPQSCTHDAVITIPGTAAGCLSSGLSEGERCVSCGAVIVAQQEITPLGHAFGAWKAVSATEQVRSCSHCTETEYRCIELAADAPTVYIVENTEMFLQNAVPQSRGSVLTAQAGRNEGEGMQFILRFAQDAQDVWFEVGPLTDEFGHTLSTVSLYRQHYVEHSVSYSPLAYEEAAYLPRGFYPDALIPIYTGEEWENTLKTDIAAQTNQGYWITVWTDSQQVPGVYTGQVTLHFNDAQIMYIPIKFEVWDIEIPQRSSAKTAFALWGVGSFYGQRNVFTGEKGKYEIEMQYYDFLAKYRISATDIPVQPSQSAVVESWFDAIAPIAEKDSCSAFRIPYYSSSATPSENDRKLRALLEQSGLLDKAFYYIVDEKYSVADLTVAEKNALLGTQSLSPDIPNLVTTHAAELFSWTNALCPLWHKVSPEWIRARQEEGKEVWWYGCAVPTYPAATYQLVDVLMSPRIVHWMQKDVGVTGELYWATTLWTRNWGDKADYTRDPWTDPYTAFANGVGENAGDGMLLYPGYYKKIGKQVSCDGYVNRNIPVPTLRLEAIRDGFEDYEYLTILQMQLQRFITDMQLSVTVDDLLATYYDALYIQGEGKYLTGNYDHANPMLIGQVRKILAQDILDFDGSYFASACRSGETTWCVTVYSAQQQTVYIEGQAVQGIKEGNCYVYRLEISQAKGNIRCIEIKIGEYTCQRILNFAI